MIKQRTIGRFKLLTTAKISEDEFYDRLIVPHARAPVFIDNGGSADLLPMKFSLLPSWSKEPKVKFATHNARLDTIDIKPTWKSVFVKKHCLVPLTDFIEPIYTGPHAGNMVSFHNHDGALMLAAGVWDEWVNKETGEIIQSFAIITHDPLPFVIEVGHDRTPVFLSEESGEEWLNSQGEPASDLKNFLLENQLSPKLAVERHRTMKPGWEKRIPKD